MQASVNCYHSCLLLHVTTDQQNYPAIISHYIALKYYRMCIGRIDIKVKSGIMQFKNCFSSL